MIVTTVGFLQSCQDQECSQVDVDDHVDIFPSKDFAHVGNHNEDDCWDEDSEDVADEGTPQGDLNNDGLLLANLGAAHLDLSDKVTVETDVAVIEQLIRLQIQEVATLNKFHPVDLCVKRVHGSVIVTDELHTKLLGQSQHVLGRFFPE